MSAEDLEQYEAELELQLYKEYKDVCPMFAYVVETERRFYLANAVRQEVRDVGGRTYVELELQDAWVWDMYRASRFVSSVRIVTFKDVNVEELPKTDISGPPPDLRPGGDPRPPAARASPASRSRPAGTRPVATASWRAQLARPGARRRARPGRASGPGCWCSAR